MDADLWINIAVVLGFVLIGGVFAGTEIALVTLRTSQVDAMAARGGRAARVAGVARDPNRFLAAVQIGVTVAGFFSAAFGASTLAADVAPLFEGLGMGEALAQTVALVVLTLVIAYVSLVLGELVPKRIALQRSEAFSLVVAPPLDRFAKLMSPVIWLLSKSTNGVVRLLGGDPRAVADEMSEEELRSIIAGHEQLPPDERAILGDVIDSGDRILRELMTPRPAMHTVSAQASVGDVVEQVKGHPWSRYPVTGSSADDVRGYLHVRELIGADPAAPISGLVREAPFLPGTARLLPTLSLMRSRSVHIAIVVDEWGGTEGIVTLEDLVEEFVGEIEDEYDAPAAALVQEEPDGALRVDARITVEDFAEHTGVELRDGDFETVAGFVLAHLGRVAKDGDEIDLGERTLTVSGVEGNRITQVTLAPVGAADGDDERDGDVA